MSHTQPNALAADTATAHHAEVILDTGADAIEGGDDCNGGMMLGTTADRLAGLRDGALAHATRAAEYIALAQAEMQKADALERTLGAGLTPTSHSGFGCEHRSTPAYASLANAGLKGEALETYRRALDASAWGVFLSVTGVAERLDHKSLEEKRASYASTVPEFTIDAMMAEFDNLARNGRDIWRRGLANVFINLDRRFKSHDGFKVGARVVLTRCFDDWGSWDWRGRDRLRDVERALRVLDGKPANPADDPNAAAGESLIEIVDKVRGQFGGVRQADAESPYLKIKTFKNGNAHLWFTRKDLVERVNEELAAYYGAALGDAIPKGQTPKRNTTTALAKSLQFYRTPPKAAAALIEHSRRLHRVKPGTYGYDPSNQPPAPRVLEPSAGDGALVAAALNADPLARVHAVEVHADRLAILAARHPQASTQLANFLDLPARPIYDVVLMNPPFGGTHWMDHITHAREFVAPGGTLAAILPASAHVSEAPINERFRAWADAQSTAGYTRKADWRDLPAESFAASGTNVNTVLLRMDKPK